MGPGFLGYLALVAFVPLSVLIYSRYPAAQATTLVVLGGSLLLPEFLGFDPVGLPRLDKENITFIGAIVGALVHQSRRLSGSRPGFGLEALAIVAVFALIPTILTNGNSTSANGIHQPGLGAYDIVSMGIDTILSLFLPFLVGRAMFKSRDDLRTLMVLLAASGAIYTAMILVEVIMSIPWRVFQFSHLIYGFGSAVSHRWGMLQPTVFMEHGLSLATFMAAALIAAAGLAKARMSVFSFNAKFVRGAALLGLVLCRNVAGVVYGFSLALAISLLRPQNVARLAVLLAFFVCTYPALRMWGLFPTDKILELAQEVGEERVSSLHKRFTDDDYVIELMGDRFAFGFGSVMRMPGVMSGARHSGDAEAGQHLAGLDGWWVIEFGMHGAVGLELRLALILLPVGFAWWRFGRLRSMKEQALVAALMAIIAMRGVDLLLNGWWNHLPVFLAGALCSFSSSLTNGPNRAPAPDDNRAPLSTRGDRDARDAPTRMEPTDSQR